MKRVVFELQNSAMGNVMYAYITHPDTAPDFNKAPTFDPNFGFPSGRKERSKFWFVRSNRSTTSSCSLAVSSVSDTIRHCTLLLLWWCLTSTETIRRIRDGKPGMATSAFTQLLSSGYCTSSQPHVYWKAMPHWWYGGTVGV